MAECSASGAWLPAFKVAAAADLALANIKERREAKAQEKAEADMQLWPLMRPASLEKALEDARQHVRLHYGLTEITITSLKKLAEACEWLDKMFVSAEDFSSISKFWK